MIISDEPCSSDSKSESNHSKDSVIITQASFMPWTTQCSAANTSAGKMVSVEPSKEGSALCSQ